MGKKKKSISFFSWALTGILSGGIRCLMHYSEVGNILPDAQGWCLGTVHVSFGALSEGQVVKVSSLISYWQRMSSKFQCLLSWLYYTSDLWIYWLRVRLSISIIWLLLSRACGARQSFGFNFLHGTFSLKIEAIHILLKLQLLWFWAQQLSRKLRFIILSVQVCFVTIAFYFLCLSWIYWRGWS